MSVARKHTFGWSIEMLRMLLDRRSLCLVLSALTVLYFLALSLGVVLYRCPLHTSTGFPCVGCGLSAAVLALLGGRFSQMWQLHPFAPYFVLLGSMIVGSAFLPDGLRIRWNAFWIRLEARTRVHGLILTILCVFGALRLLGQLLMTQ